MGEIRSMSGFGAARGTGSGAQVEAELKAVNGRFLKISLRTPPALRHREADLEALCKRSLVRGSVNLSLTFRPTDPEMMVHVDEAVVRGYQAAFSRLNIPDATLANLPGVIASSGAAEITGEQWQLVLAVVQDALERLAAMRRTEGEGLAGVVVELLRSVEETTSQIRQRIPTILDDHQRKLRERLNALLKDAALTMDEDRLMREVAIFADRSDVTEELERLALHIQHARELLETGGAIGRQLDFLAQELLREANTLGSKSSDGVTAQWVVALKTDIERIKEQVANIE